MLLPQAKEREFRFKLALRMGLPIFALVSALLLNTLISDDIHITSEFYTNAVLIFGFSIYFMLHIIYSGFDIRITEITSKTFTREYLYSYLKKELKKKKDYTLVLISVDNLSDINATYGISNGDKVLLEAAKWIASQLEDKKIQNFPLGHVKGGDFLIGLNGTKSEHNILVDMMCLRASELKVDNIEVKISGAITDSSYSNELEYMVENLFEMLELKKQEKSSYEDGIDPNELESLVINALNKNCFSLMTQDVFEDKKIAIKECFIKLKRPDDTPIHQKSYMKVISKLGLNVEYDLMILEKVISLCNENIEFRYAVNIAPSSLRNHIFLSKIKERLKDNPASRDKIIFILRENEYYSHIDRYNSIIKSLQNLGIKIAIDRLGAIHTSFLYLRDLNIDIVRYDNFYMKKIENKKYKAEIEGFNLMAHSKGLKTWIKMVESQETLDVLRDINIDYKQGRYLANLEKIYES